MILGSKELHKLIEEEKLIENLYDREKNNSEGAGVDLRMGEIYELVGEGFLGIEDRKTPEVKLIAKFNSNKEQNFVFEPGKYYLVKTMERVNLPTDLTAMIYSRGTLFRSGITLYVGIVHGGYSGEFTFGICNQGSNNIKISLGARIAHVIFEKVSGEVNKYRGQWQGGRVTTEGIEKQV